MTKENNYISSLLIRSLRGKRTAAQMSRVLGYSSNQVNRWESSHSLITWESLIDFCIKRDVDVKKNLYAAFAYTGKVESVKDIILFFTGKKLNKEIAEILGISTSTISNWINGKTPPSAEKIFEVVKHSNYSFTDFITCLVPAEIQIEELKELIEKLDETQKSILSKPWLIGLLSLIETILAENCQNLEEELSKRLYIDKRISRKIIDDLKKEKFFNWNKIEKKYELDVMQKPLNLAANRELLVESIAFWNEYALKVANKTQVNVENKNRAAFITFSVAEEDIPKLHELFSIAFHKINELCKNKKGKKVFTLTSLLAEIDGKNFGEVLK